MEGAVAPHGFCAAHNKHCIHVADLEIGDGDHRPLEQRLPRNKVVAHGNKYGREKGKEKEGEFVISMNAANT